MTDSGPQRWTQDERRRALKAFLESEEGKRFLDVYSHDCTAEEDREIFLRDAERRSQSDDQDAGRWWSSLRAMLKDSPDKSLALVEPLAQAGIAIEDIYECLPDDFEPVSLIQAISQARNVREGVAGGLPPGITNAAGLTNEQLRNRLEAVKAQLGLEYAGDDARQWWNDFEIESSGWPAPILRLAEELANRKATVAEFYDAYVRSNTDNIQAILHYLDYARLKQAETTQPPIAREKGRPGAVGGDSGWWMKPAPRMTRVRGWTGEQIRSRLEEVKPQLNLDNATGPARQWWEDFEEENQHRPALILRLAEELANRKATISEFHRADGLSEARGILANLYFLDYMRLIREEDEFETIVLDETGQAKERRWLKAHKLIERLAPGINLEMIEIPGGTFLMGTAEEDVEKVIEEYTRYGLDKEDSERWVNSERPRHEVTVSPFYIGKFTITQAQWGIVARWERIERELDPAPSNFKGNERPVERVSWEDAKEFCARLTQKTGRAYRLPTEAEWEYACRAGTTTPFAFGETITPEIVNYDGNRPYAKAEKGKYRQETVPVGSLGVANSFGLFDMHGNVWEWCEDVWHDNYRDAPVDGSAWLSGGDSNNRVLRGGSWLSYGDYCRSADRVHNEPDIRDVSVGFRVVVGARTS